MTDTPENIAGDDAALRAAGQRLDAALAGLEARLGRLSASVTPAAAPETGGSATREAALEAALQEASQTLGGLIAEVRDAIAAAEEAAASEAAEGADGQG